MMTAVIALFTQGRDNEVVRLSAKAFHSHLTLLGSLLGLNSLVSPPVLFSNLAPVLRYVSRRSLSSSICLPANP